MDPWSQLGKRLAQTNAPSIDVQSGMRPISQVAGRLIGLTPTLNSEPHRCIWDLIPVESIANPARHIRESRQPVGGSHEYRKWGKTRAATADPHQPFVNAPLQDDGQWCETTVVAISTGTWTYWSSNPSRWSKCHSVENSCGFFDLFSDSYYHYAL